MSPPKRLNLVVSNSSALLHQLRWYAFRRLDMKIRVGATVPALIRLVDQEAPDAVVVETALADGDGFAVAHAVKVGRKLSRVPVILLAEAKVSPTLAAALTKSQADQLLVSPLAPGQLYDALADFFDLPRRLQTRAPSDVRVALTIGDQEVPSRLMDLTVSGARLRLPVAPPRATTVLLRLPTGPGASCSLKAKVVWQRAYERSVELAVRFPELTPAERDQLRTLLTWDIEPREPGQLVRILVDLDDRADFTGLREQLRGPVEFDLSQINRINSVGVGLWVAFIESLPPLLAYSFSRCSTSFTEQAAYLPALVGKGRILSVFAPYFCSSCDTELEREVSAAAAQAGPPELTCTTCGRPLKFDGDARRFFAALAPDGG